MREPKDMLGAFMEAAPRLLPFNDPYQDVIDRCKPHPKDPSVLFTTNRDDMIAIHSPRVAAVIWVRDIDEAMKAEIEALQANPRIIEISQEYRFNETPPEEVQLLRSDLRMLAHLRAELSGEHLTRPIFKAVRADQIDQTLPHLKNDADFSFCGDMGFHSDRKDVGLRLHTAYSGQTIQGLSQRAIERIEAAGIETDTLYKGQDRVLRTQLRPEDIIDDIPPFAVAAFKGRGYQPPPSARPLGPSAPPHLFWRHRGPDRYRTDGIAAIFGQPFDTALANEMQFPFPEARI